MSDSAMQLMVTLIGAVCCSCDRADSTRCTVKDLPVPGKPLMYTALQRRQGHQD